MEKDELRDKLMKLDSTYMRLWGQAPVARDLYETINDNKAIIAEYNDKFIVIDCYIEGENLVLLKGNYTIEDLTGVKIKRRKYEMIFTID